MTCLLSQLTKNESKENSLICLAKKVVGFLLRARIYALAHAFSYVVITALLIITATLNLNATNNITATCRTTQFAIGSNTLTTLPFFKANINYNIPEYLTDSLRDILLGYSIEGYTNQLKINNQKDPALSKFLHANIYIMLFIVVTLTAIIIAFVIYRRRVKKQISTFVNEIDELKQVIPASLPQTKNINLMKNETDATPAQMLEGKKFIKKITDLINESENINCNVEVLASQMGMSSQTLRRRIVAATGESPKVLVNNLKMQRAHDLLVNKPDMPVAQIAVHCGFTESSSFIRSFQNHFGMSPTQYRQTHKLENAD